MQEHLLRSVISICNNNRVSLIGRVSSKKFRNFIDGHVIHTRLHGTKKVMIKVGNTYRLMNYQVVCLPRNWIIISDYTTHCLSSTIAQGWVVRQDIYREEMVLYYQIRSS